MAGRDWSEVVEEAVRRHVDSTGDPVFTRQELIDAELNRIVNETGSEGATEAAPTVLSLTADLLTPGVQPTEAVAPGQASVIATGGMLPRGADAVTDHTDRRDAQAEREDAGLVGAQSEHLLRHAEAVLLPGSPLHRRPQKFKERSCSA